MSSVNPAEPPPPAAAVEPLPNGFGVPAALLALAAPIIASMVSRTAMNFVDFVMVSQLGTEAQAAVVPAGILLFCFIAFGFGMLSAVNTYVSQALGRGDAWGCASYGWQGFWLGIGLGGVILPAYFGVPAFFAWVGHEPAVAEMETIYARIGIIGMAPTLAGAALANFAQGVHRPAVGFWAMLIANLFNVAGNYALIFGHWGFPAMGIAGAAWATTLAATLQMLVLLAWLVGPSVAAQFPTRRAWRLDLRRMRQLLWLGAPAGVHFVVDVVAFTVFTLLMVGRFGTQQLAASNIAFKLLELSFMPGIGLGAALTVAVGKAIGRGRPDHARLVTRWAAGLCVAYMGAVGLSYAVFGEQLARLLSPDTANPDPVVIAWARRLLLLAAVFQMFDALNIVHISALRGAGDNHVPAAMAATMVVTLLIGGGFAAVYLMPQWGAAGPWIAATAYVVVLGLGMWARWHFGPWERIDLHGKSEGRIGDSAPAV